MAARREHSRRGWIILSSGTKWEDWVYPTEEAARLTAERCNVPDATIVEGSLQGSVIRDRQYSSRMLADRRWRS